jgi:LL-diaminopimelate aminotransferase
MPKMNENFNNLKQNYLFIEISKRVGEFTAANPNSLLIRMGIGDVTLPLSPCVAEAGKKAFEEMGVKETFRGYEDSGRGYEFLRNAVSGYYKSFGADVTADEIFISDGAKSDSGNIGDIFSTDCPVIVTDPAYPVYVDSSIMAGRQVAFTDFLPPVGNDDPGVPNSSLIYLCSPNNPTGAAYTYDELEKWVNLAIKTDSVIIYDAAYESFITEPDKPRSIYLIKDAKTCAIEICSLSKTAGFTGTRCGYTIIPKDIKLSVGQDNPGAPSKDPVPLHQLWSRRQGSKFNGVSYPVQRAAEAVFSPIGQQQTKKALEYYQTNAQIIMKTLTELKIEFTGGINSPYIWFKCPNNMDSWEFFDFMLSRANVVGTPGVGFGKNGDGWFRLTSFNTHENTEEAMKRLKNIL